MFIIIPLKHREIHHPKDWMLGLRRWDKGNVSKLTKTNIYPIRNAIIASKITRILTWSTKPNSCATYNLSRSRVLFTDFCAPTANKIRSPDLAEQRFNNFSLFSSFKLDAKAGLPSSAPENPQKTVSSEHRGYFYTKLIQNQRTITCDLQERQTFSPWFNCFIIYITLF